MVREGNRTGQGGIGGVKGALNRGGKTETGLFSGAVFKGRLADLASSRVPSSLSFPDQAGTH